MPPGRHLQRFRIKDFGGLWTAGAQSLMPADKAKVMSGCHPQIGGGLRSFLKVTQTLPGSGLLRGAAERAVGFGITTKGSLAGTVAPTLYLLTVDGYNGAKFTGAANESWTTPDTADLDIAGDIDLRALAIMDDWSPALTSFVSNLNSTSFLGYELRIGSGGLLVIAWGNGAAVTAMTSTAAVPFANNTKGWVRATLDVNDGAGNRVANFYTSTDGVTWTPLGATVTTAGTTSISASANALTIGARPGGINLLSGEVIRVEVYDGIAGTLRASPDWGTYPVGTTSITDIQSPARVYTAGSAGTVIRTAYDYPSDWQLWRWSIDQAMTSWSRASTAAFAGMTSDPETSPPPVQPSFVRYGGSAGFFLAEWDYFALSLRETAGTGSGVYEVNGDTGVVTRNTTGANNAYGATAIVDHQSRLVVGYQDKILYTAPIAFDFGAVGAGELRLNPQGFLTSGATSVHEGSLTSWMISIPPGDLIVATRDGRIYNVQGDIADPTVRELGRWTTMANHQPIVTPAGIFFLLPNQGVAALGLDGSVTVLSNDILPSLWNLEDPALGLGQLAGTERYLFAPNAHSTADHRNGALVFDTDTKAWFTSTHETEHTIRNPRMIQSDNNPRASGIWMVPSTSPFGTSANYAFQIRTGADEDAGLAEERNSVWEYESADLREPGFNYLDVHEAVIPVYAWNASSTLTVTIGATSRVLALPAGRSIQTLAFRERGSTLSVRLLAESNDTAVEAPMIEEIDVGWKDGPPL